MCKFSIDLILLDLHCEICRANDAGESCPLQYWSTVHQVIGTTCNVCVVWHFNDKDGTCKTNQSSQTIYISGTRHLLHVGYFVDCKVRGNSMFSQHPLTSSAHHSVCRGPRLLPLRLTQNVSADRTLRFGIENTAMRAFQARNDLKSTFSCQYLHAWISHLREMACMIDMSRNVHRKVLQEGLIGKVSILNLCVAFPERTQSVRRVPVQGISVKLF